MRRLFFEKADYMKKISSLLLIIIIILSLSACETAVMKSAVESAAPTDFEIGVLKEEGSGAEAALRDELNALEEPFGLIKGDKYYNIHLGLVFNLPEGWSYFDSSVLYNASANGEFKEDGLSYEFAARSGDGVRYIILLIEDMRENDKNSFVSEKIYQKQIVNDLTGFNSAYKKLSVGTRSIGAYKYSVLYMKAPDDGLFESYFSLRFGNYMVNIICRDKVEKAGYTLFKNFEEFE